jgi:hypothetical protein
MSEIFNKDVSVLGNLTLAPTNGPGNIIVITGTGIVKFRTPAELVSDLGITSDANYVHDQGTPASVWNVTHNLGKRATPVVVDSAGTVVVGQIDFVDDNNVTLTFNGSFSGYAYFN